jgi:hypothetical protein
MAINLALECESKRIQEDFGLHVFPLVLPCVVDCKLLGRNLNTKHVSHTKAVMEIDYGAKVDNRLNGRGLKLTTSLQLIQVRTQSETPDTQAQHYPST